MVHSATLLASLSSMGATMAMATEVCPNGYTFEEGSVDGLNDDPDIHFVFRVHPEPKIDRAGCAKECNENNMKRGEECHSFMHKEVEGAESICMLYKVKHHTTKKSDALRPFTFCGRNEGFSPVVSATATTVTPTEISPVVSEESRDGRCYVTCTDIIVDIENSCAGRQESCQFKCGSTPVCSKCGPLDFLINNTGNNPHNVLDCREKGVQQINILSPVLPQELTQYTADGARYTTYRRNELSVEQGQATAIALDVASGFTNKTCTEDSNCGAFFACESSLCQVRRSTGGGYSGGLIVYPRIR